MALQFTYGVGPGQISIEKWFPIAWVLHGIRSRDEFAEHLCKLRKNYGLRCARDCVSHAIYVGVYPLKK